LAGLEFIGVPLHPDFTLDTKAMLEAIVRHRPALVYLPFPNNPTGTLFPDEEMERIIDAAKQTSLVIWREFT
jgi:histidinol-phosphate aminotransferase